MSPTPVKLAVIRSVFGVLGAALALGAASADTLVVGNKNENTISFIDVETGEIVAKTASGSQPHELTLSPDGRLAVAAAYGTFNDPGNELYVYNVEDGALNRTIELQAGIAPHSVNWIPGTDHIAVTAERIQTVLVVDMATGETLGSAETGEERSHMVIVRPDGARAYVASQTRGAVTAIDLKTVSTIKTVKTGDGAESIKISPDGSEIWTGDNGDETISVFNAETLERVHVIDMETPPLRLEFSPDGARVAVAEYAEFRIAEYDAYTKERLRVAPIAGVGTTPGPLAMVYSNDGSRLYVTVPANGSVVELDVATWRQLRIISSGAGADGIAYSTVDTVRD